MSKANLRPLPVKKDLAPAAVCGMKDYTYVKKAEICKENPSLDLGLCFPVVLIAPVTGKWRSIGS